MLSLKNPQFRSDWVKIVNFLIKLFIFTCTFLHHTLFGKFRLHSNFLIDKGRIFCENFAQIYQFLFIFRTLYLIETSVFIQYALMYAFSNLHALYSDTRTEPVEL